MKSMLSFVLSLMVFIASGIDAGAQTAAMAPTTCPAGSKLVQAYTKKNGTTVAAHCKKSKMTSGAAMDSAAPAASPDAMMTPAPMASKGATSSSSMSADSCPPGKTLVKGYTTKKGDKVAAYCRKSHKKKSG